ncbi:MAG: HipA domain-containing protein [Lachnospiraceae bacterium]
MPIDFTDCKKNKFKVFGGANGAKIGIFYNDESYMLKFPSESKLNKNMSYSNSTVSEHIGCRIFSLLSIPSQETLVGNYHHEGRDKIVVACKDLETDGYKLKDFASLKNTIIDSVRGGYGTELSDVLQTIEEQQFVSPVKLKRFFWEMFVADAFIGNFDRHNGNWGFLLNEEKQDIKIAPVFDCGSCLFAEMDILKMQEVINSKQELEYRLFVIPKSAIMENEKKISYFDFLKSGKNEDCTKALKEVTKRIDLDKINAMIDEIPLITDVEKTFYKFMLKERKTRIHDKAIELLEEQRSIPI